MSSQAQLSPPIPAPATMTFLTPCRCLTSARPASLSASRRVMEADMCAMLLPGAAPFPRDFTVPARCERKRVIAPNMYGRAAIDCGSVGDRQHGRRQSGYERMRHVALRVLERCLPMKLPHYAILSAPLVVLLLDTSITAQRPANASSPFVSAQPSRNVTAFTLTSTDLKDGAFADAQVLNTVGCSGNNVSPQLSW